MLFALYELTWWHWRGSDRSIDALDALVQAEVAKFTDYDTHPQTFVELRDLMSTVNYDHRFNSHGIEARAPEGWEAACKKFELDPATAQKQARLIIAGLQAYLSAEQLYELCLLGLTRLPAAEHSKLTLYVANTTS